MPRVVPTSHEGPTAAMASGPTGSYTLQIVGEGFVERHALPARGEVVLGRSAAVEVQIDDASISRRHAVLRIGKQLELEDLGSANGTRVGDQRLVQGEPVIVQAHDVLQLGAVMIVVRTGGSEQPAVGARPIAQPRPARGGGMIARSASTRALLTLIDRVAASDLAVLITGETGVGKEVAATELHQRSPRAERPLVRINCAALAESLLESELFGHDKGAFTGAVAAKPGLLESADGGTVFLDEIGELPLTLQAKLLRVLETRQVTRLGGLKPRTLDVRFVAATNRDLPVEVAAGRFRQDLYFRLDGITLRLPPLRERREEIEPLVQAFVTAAAAKIAGRRPPQLTPAALQRLTTYPWPGNVRELRNVVERAVVLNDSDTLDTSAFEPFLTAVEVSAAAPASTEPLEALRPEARAERDRILAALAESAGNQSQAAKRLGISRATLLMRLDAFRIPRPRKRSPFGE